ncbi:MAG: LPP20 family lipoprotein [Bacteroides sp.]|nr:LPP20 family lipoprotein [Prevotella sp.]MCM1408598.1 LPP20 family lipoprotein [Treponema brennaborense]MCM1468914.1 LPP20 family lipoprotein [Bacteroides sp.]
MFVLIRKRTVFSSALTALVLMCACSCATDKNIPAETASSSEAAEQARRAAADAFADSDSFGRFAQTKPLAAENSVPDKTAPKKIDSADAVFNTADTEPVWIKKPQTGADQSEFMTACGSGKTMKDAEHSAAAALAKMIRQNISSSSLVLSRDVFDSSGGDESYSAVSEVIETETMIDALVGVRIAEFWKSRSGTVYALAVMNRAEASMYYRRKIEEFSGRIEKLIADAQASPGLFEGYASLQQATAAAHDVSDFMDIVYAADPAAYRTIRLPYGSAAAVEAEAFQFAAFVPMNILNAEAADNRIPAAVAKVFAGLGFKPEITSAVQTASAAPYCCTVSLSFQDIPSETNSYVRYICTVTLKETHSEAILYTCSLNGREGHLTAEEARQRSLRTLEKKLSTEFAENFIAFLRGGNA